MKYFNNKEVLRELWDEAENMATRHIAFSGDLFPWRKHYVYTRWWRRHARALMKAITPLLKQAELIDEATEKYLEEK